MEQPAKITPRRICEIAAAFKIRASAASEITAGGSITEKQLETLDKHQKRHAAFLQGKEKPLTDNMTAEMLELIDKRDNPVLPVGAKKYCKKWLKEYLYGRRKQIKSKYIEKGNTHEELGFDVMAIELNLGMVEKNTTFYQNEWMCGTPDLCLPGTVYDNKCSYELDTFPMFESENPKPEYEDQLNVYAELLSVDTAVLAYTLIDASPEIIESEVKWLQTPDEICTRIRELVYTKEYFLTLVERFCPLATDLAFVEIPHNERIVSFTFTRNPAYITLLKQRVLMCRKEIKELLTIKYSSKNGN